MPKKIFKHIYYLYICTLLVGPVAAQQLSLKVVAEQEIDTLLLDSLNTSFEFDNYLTLKAQVDTLTARFQKIGFLDSRLEEINKSSDSSYSASFYLGNRWREIELTYRPVDFDPSEVKFLGKKINDSSFVIPFTELQNTLIKLGLNKAQSGAPFTSIQLTAIEKKDLKTLLANLKVQERGIRTIDGLVIKGYEKFPKSFLMYYAGVRKGKIFHRKKLIEQSEQLNYLGFVNTIKPPEALFKKDSTLIYFYLEKKNNNLFDGIIGFATNEQSQKLEFNGFLSLELNNNLNFGEQLKIDYKADGREQQNFQAYTKMPYLFKTPFGISLELKIFKRDSTFATSEQQIRLLYQASPKISFYLGYKGYESSNLLDEPIAGAAVEDYDSDFLLVGAQFMKTQNNRLFPIKTNFSLESEMGKRNQLNTSENQIRLTARASNIFNLNEYNAIYLGIETGYLQSDTYLVNELFRFGGVKSIRGFNENSIDASLYSVLNSEYRYLFNESLYVNSILDFAYFENEIFNTQEEIYSFGFGLGVNTRSGVLRLNIANGITRNQDVNLSNVKIHIILSASF